MNETGLVVEELNSWGIPPEDDRSYKLNEFQFVQYCLDNCSSIGEVLELKDSISIEPVFVNLHYLISDSEGEVAVVEFYDGKSFFYSGDEVGYPVLSNNHYNQLVKYISNFEGFGGKQELLSTNSSGERFVRVATMIKELRSNSLEVGVQDAFLILDRVKQKDTQWSIVYDIKKQKIYFTTAWNDSLCVIDCKGFDFSVKTSAMMLDIKKQYEGLLNTHFSDFDLAVNKGLLKSVYQQLVLDGYDNKIKEKILNIAEFAEDIGVKKSNDLLI
ncbi:linear amide C-N hydrolase [Marinilabilia rubra]|uniref:Choloylglycine hydrolase/NAAA C-terminal domain-containing protein n=1 Tax=Marinilabilia rubra TaxID=2162893 RepID=A0A2U2B742_9BACT|nr:linear amide C-N hydrolase [Marinilabilia rubra]PWD98899.1 hypothetical protein DDZ16_12935 [Marinilabilia rubra]